MLFLNSLHRLHDPPHCYKTKCLHLPGIEQFIKGHFIYNTYEQIIAIHRATLYSSYSRCAMNKIGGVPSIGSTTQRNLSYLLFNCLFLL